MSRWYAETGAWAGRVGSGRDGRGRRRAERHGRSGVLRARYNAAVPDSRIPRLIAVGLIVAACGGSPQVGSPVATSSTALPSTAATTIDPGLTPGVSAEPTTSASPTQTATPKLTATPKPTLRPTPTTKPAPTPKPTPRPTPIAVIRAVEAKDFAFAPASLSAPAGAPFKIVFSNADASIPHNIEIRTSDGVSRFKGTIITGVATITYAVPALAAGDYRLACIVHSNMTGTLTVH